MTFSECEQVVGRDKGGVGIVGGFENDSSFILDLILTNINLLSKYSMNI